MAQTSRSDPAIGGAVPTLSALAELGQPRRAVEDFGRCIALDRGNVEALRNRAMLYCELGEPDKAIPDYDEIIRLDPDDPSVREERRLAVGQAELEGR